MYSPALLSVDKLKTIVTKNYWTNEVTNKLFSRKWNVFLSGMLYILKRRNTSVLFVNSTARLQSVFKGAVVFRTRDRPILLLLLHLATLLLKFLPFM